MKEHNLPVYFIRHNFTSEKGIELLPELIRNNWISIHIDSEQEKRGYDTFTLFGEPIEGPVPPIVRYWFSILKSLETKDILMVCQYEKGRCLIEILKQGQKEFEIDQEREFKGLKLSDVKEFSYSEYPLLYAVLPKMGTISSVKQRKNFIHHLYFGYPLELKLENFTPKQIEGICLEWLRSEYAGDLRLKYQLLPIGGNMPNIDIIGVSVNSQDIIAQVSHTSDTKTIEKKVAGLNTVQGKRTVLFSNSDKPHGEVTSVHLKKVWSDLINDKEYKEMLERQLKL